ncbi:MAG: hypothetical protein ACQERJ_09155, partial [Bacillota bacterium]
MSAILTSKRGKLLIVLTLIVGMIGLVGCSDDDDNSTSKTYNVSGTVVSNDGQPLGGITVAGGSAQTATNTNGEWSLTNIKEGKVIKAVDTAGYTFTGSHKVTANKSNIQFKAGEDKSGDSLVSIVSTSAADQNTIEVEFSDEIDEVNANNFTVPNAEVDQVLQAGEKVTIVLKNFIPNNATVFFTGVTVDGETATIPAQEVNTAEVEIPYVELNSDQEVVALNPDTDTASVELTTNLVNFPAGAEATIEFDTNSEVAQISAEETTSEQSKTIRLVVSDITATKQIKVTATVKEVKNPDNGQSYPEYKENVAAVDKTITFSPDIDSGGDDAQSFTLNKAIANQADRLTIWLDKPVTEDLVTHLNANLDRIVVDDNTTDNNENTIIPVAKVVKTGEKQLLVILDSGSAGDRSYFPLDDNVTHKIKFDGSYQGGYVLSGVDEFFLEDSNYIKLTNVYTSQTDESLSDKQLKVVFSEAVNNFTNSDNAAAAEYSVRNLKNWVIDGTNLGTSLPSHTNAIFPVDVANDVTVEVKHSNPEKLTRDVVILTFATPESDSDGGADGIFENVQSFLSEGTHNLQVNTIGDWASVTHNANMVSTLNDEYQGIPTSDITATWRADSPEQFVVEFSGTVLDEDGEINGDNFEIIIPDQDADEQEYGDNSFAVLTEGNGDFTITELAEGEKYLIEMNQDWTQFYNTESTGDNYHMNRFNPLRLRVKGLKDTFGYDLASDPNIVVVDSDIDLSEDATSPSLTDAEILTTIKGNAYESDLVEEFSTKIYDNNGAVITNGLEEDLEVSNDAGAVLLEFNEPIQVKDQYGDQHQGSTIATTPSQQQNSANGGVKEITFEYVNENTGNTVEGTIAKVINNDEKETARDYAVIVVPINENVESAALANGNWKLVVRDVTDDVGNAMNTETITGIEISESDGESPVPTPDKPFDLIKVDAHYNVVPWLDDYSQDELNTNDAKDIIHVQFNKPVALTGVASPLKKSNWRLNGEELPVDGTRIEKGILGENSELDIDGDGTLEKLNQTQYAVTIILPDGALEGHNSNHTLTLI